VRYRPGRRRFLALATRFHTLILDAIPRLSPDNYDVAWRFIVLTDGTARPPGQAGGIGSGAT
jgi:predicted ATPase